MIADISYKEYRKQGDIHGTVLYPAVMVAPVQKDVLTYIINKMNIKSVLDPFHGSGTSLYETLEISENIKLVGCDINPLANLITKVKLQGVTKNIEKDIKQLKTCIQTENTEAIYRFNNSRKWFREDIAEDLTKIRNAIIKINCSKNRLFFWCMLTDIIRKYSNTRSSTYKLHIKPIERINTMNNRVVEDFINSIEKNSIMYKESSESFTLYKCDSLIKMREFKDREFDVLISSPPYGDNATTVPYGQFSMLSLYWIDKKDLELEGWELDNYSLIDSKSMGGKNVKILIDDLEKELIQPYLKQISLKKQKKVLSFFNDYFIFLKQACRVTNHYLVLTLGNRTVDGVKLNLTNITMKYLEVNGFVKEELLSRDIVNKRTPRTISKVNNKPVYSMNKEYVLIYRKN